MKCFSELKYDLKVAFNFWSLVNKLLPSYIPLIVISSVFYALLPLINVIMPKYIINELLTSQRINVLIYNVIIVILGNLVLNIVNDLFNKNIDIANKKLMNLIDLHIGKHIIEMDFEKLENPEILDLKEHALAPVNGQNAIFRMVNSFKKIVQASISAIGLIAIILTLNLIIILVILGIIILNSFIFRKSQESQFNFHKMLAPINRKFGYYKTLSSDFSMAKDVRLYNISPYILKKIDTYNKESYDCFSKMFAVVGLFKGLSNINIQIQMIVVYAYMIYKVYVRSINIGSFVMYISASNNFFNNTSTLLSSFIEFRQMCKYLDLFMQFEGIKSDNLKTIRKIYEIENPTIEFINVYFRYANSNNYAINNLSLKIKYGEKLSIVGGNGAGKSTLIKLLCRLYKPEKGEILINGINIQEYEYSDYLKLLSVVFQDYKIFAFSVKENISFNNFLDNSNQRIVLALKKVGLYEKIVSLERGVDTQVYKIFDNNGIELSGGESQKLAIARAAFKDSPIVILDEPTAALDPYAEYDIYSNFNTLIGTNTVIYISHRLSSCLFCEKIAVLENGKLIEYGNHNELIKSNGKYAEMWKTQAQYYNN